MELNKAPAITVRCFDFAVNVVASVKNSTRSRE